MASDSDKTAINIPGLAGLIVFYFLILFAGIFSKKYDVTMMRFAN